MTPAEPLQLTRILHPCVLASAGGTSILFDPCFGTFTRRRLTSGLIGIRMPDPGLAPESICGLTVIAVSHGHEDHLDLQGLRRIPGRSARVVVPTRRLESMVRRLGFAHVERIGLWEEASGPGWRLLAVPARSPNAWREVSYVADLGGVRLLHAGDTAMHRWFPEIARRAAPRIGCLPINGVSMLGVRLTMTPRQAAEAAGRLGLEYVMPIHHEMVFTRASRLLYSSGGSEKEFEEALKELAPESRILAADRGVPVRIP